MTREVRYYKKDGTTEVATAATAGAYYAVFEGKFRTHLLGDGVPELFKNGKWVLRDGSPAPVPA